MMLKINFVCTNCNMSSITNITQIWTLSQNIFSIVDPIFLFYRIQETGKQSYLSLSFIKIPFKITEYCIIHSVGWLISSRNKKFTRLGFLHEYMMNDCFSRYFFLIKKLFLTIFGSFTYGLSLLVLRTVQVKKRTFDNFYNFLNQNWINCNH